MDVDRRKELLHIYRDGLLNNTLPFWIPACVDREYGGFITSLDQDGSRIDTDKGVWQQCRFSWLLGELYNEVEPRPEWLELLKHGIDFIDGFCVDPSDGRMWFELTQQGQPLRKRRYAFSESFAAIAYGELAKATGDQQYAEKAEQAFMQFIDHNLHPRGVQPKYTEVRPLRGIGFPMIAIFAAQQLRDSIGLDSAHQWIDRCVDEIRRLHLNPELECVLETVSPTGEVIDSFLGRTLNPGHAIEAAWFIMQEGKLRNDPSLVQTGCQMLDWMWARGWDPEHGGILYFVDVHDRPVQEYWHDMKFWWPQNETIIATLLAWQLTGDPKYAQWHQAIHDWAHSVFPDPVHGEWFGYLHRDGRLSSTAKGNLFKGPFHLPRMQLFCWRIIEETLASESN